MKVDLYGQRLKEKNKSAKDTTKQNRSLYKRLSSDKENSQSQYSENIP